jgi:serine/threonine protein kinase
MTLDIVNFPSRSQDHPRKPEPTPEPKISFWKSRNNSPLKTGRSRPQHPTLQKGINKFKLMKMLGQGTFSDVYLALDKKTYTLWAVKRYKKSLLNTS